MQKGGVPGSKSAAPTLRAVCTLFVWSALLVSSVILAGCGNSEEDNSDIETSERRLRSGSATSPSTSNPDPVPGSRPTPVQTSGPSPTPEAQVDPSCSAHTACSHLHGHCCPSWTGMMLGCCSEPAPQPSEPAPQPSEPAPAPEALIDPLCSGHAACSYLHGRCCPTWTGMMLGCCPEPAPQPSEPTPQPSEPTPQPSEEYDVIVVGSGLVGSAVAAKLSEIMPERTVLVLEAGKASQASLGGTSSPATWDNGQWSVWPDMQGNLTKYDVPGNYGGMHCWDKSCYHAFQEFPAYQCRVLGGCAVKNGALTQRPASRMFDAWPQGWKWEDMLPYYEAVERDFSITDTPSADGRTYLAGAGTDFFRDALGALPLQEEDTLTPRGGTMGKPYVAAGDGIRESTASKYLPEALSRSNFELLLEVHVTEILHDGQGKAFGVKYLHDNVEKQAKLHKNGILVLSAGALGSPGLLLQSGFQHLDAKIGEFLSEHTYVADRYSVPAGAIKETFDYLNPPASAKDLYYRERSGALAQYGPTLTAFFKDAHSPGGPEEFDVEVFIAPTSVETELTVSFALMRPTCSQGVVVASETEVTFKYGGANLHKACPRDTEMMDSAREQVREAMRMVGATRDSSVGPYDMNHWAGSCSLGHCVSPETLLVRGTRNVAIADASILPGQVWGHPAHTLRALALKATDVLERTLREAMH